VSWGINVRRLAAVDMYGAHGRLVRRRAILAEFIVGAAGCLALGIITVLHPGLYDRLTGAWLIGAGLNYAPLAAHALDLTRQGRLETELRDVDVAAEAGYYSRAQFWIMLPLAMVAADLVRRASARSGARSS